jgi:hypothetical protein
MATFDTYTDHRPIVASGGTNAAGFPKVTVFQNEFDASRRNLAQDDIAEVLSIPAGSLVSAVFVEVLDGEAGVTVNVGDGDDPDGFFAAASVATDGAYHSSVPSAAAYSGGQFYDTDDTIDVQVASAGGAETARIRVVASVTAIG